MRENVVRHLRDVVGLDPEEIPGVYGIFRKTLGESLDGLRAAADPVDFRGIRSATLASASVAFAHDPHHDVLDIVIFLYRRHIGDSSSLNPAFYEEVSRYPQIVDYLEQQQQYRRNDFIVFMQRGVDEGFFRNDINYTIISHVFEALGNYMQQTQLYHKFTFEELFFNMLFVTLRGFCTAKGISKLDQFFAANRL